MNLISCSGQSQNLDNQKLLAPRTIDNNKPIIILVPGYSFSDVIFGSNDNTSEFHCIPKALPVSRQGSDYFFDLPTWLLEDGGYDVRIASVENNHERTDSILVNAECLRNQILDAAMESPTGDVIVIAHSMGGLVARAYVQSLEFLKDTARLGLPPVEKLFLVATPNQAMPFHFWLNLLLHCEDANTKQRAACEFSSSEWIKIFNNTYHNFPSTLDVYLIGGTLHNGCLGFWSGLYICTFSGPNDGTIPTQSSIGLDGVRGKAIVEETHLKSVGQPTYFAAYKGQKSQAYLKCIYPVLIEGNPDGCYTNNALQCPSLQLLARLLILCLVLLGIRYMIREYKFWTHPEDI